MKILLYNPNTSESITNTLYETAKLVVSQGTTLVPMTAKKGFPYISTKAEAQIAGTTVLEVIAEKHLEYDAIIIAAFGDPGLIAARDLFNIPIIGLGEAAMLSACLFGKKFSIISFTNAMSAWYEESVELLGLQHRYAGFRAIDGVVLSIDQIKSLQKDALIQSANKAINADGGNVIIFAGAPLSGFKKIVQEEISVPIIDCAEAALKQAELSVIMNHGTSLKKKLPPKKSVGLDKKLANYIAHKF
jgi:Asp/Glu/hydantoin racemase|tara:strand:+ start:76 stop:813 length:738 start_codon:yes stop_codon:yes gene_type:complete